MLQKNKIPMSLEDRLNSAKKQKKLTIAPTLRRVILRSRWYATIGGIVMIIAAVRELNQWSLDDPSPIALLASIGGLLLSTALLTVSRKISLAADAQNYTAIPKLLERLQAICTSALLFLIGSEILGILMNDREGDNTQLILLLPTIPLLVIFGVWLKDILKAREEVTTLVQTSVF